MSIGIHAGRAARGACLALALTTTSGRTGEAPSEHPACPPGAIRVAPGVSIQEAVDRAGAGARFCLGAGVHRMQIVRPRNGQAFFGEQGAILDGSQRVTGFARAGRFWVAGGQPSPLESRGSCLAGRPCLRRAALFIDGVPLRQVATPQEMGQDTFLFDPAAATLSLARDPVGHTVDSARAAFAFSGHAEDVEIRGLVIEKYNSLAQYGAVQAAGGRRWLIAQSELRFNSGVGVVLGNGATLQDSNVHHNGQLGVGGTGAGFSILRNRIHANNTHGYDPEWEAGGLKLAVARDVVLRENHVHGNDGPGLWCDIDCERVLFEANRVEDNRGPGIFYEISRRATIRNNILLRNGAGPRAWVWGAEIQVAASAEIEVFGNDLTVAPGGHGIVLVDQGRPHARGGGFYQTRDNMVHDNTTTYEGVGRSGGTSDVPAGLPQAGIIEAGNNRYDRNTYRYRRGFDPLFLWGPELSFTSFRKAGQEANGRLVLWDEIEASGR